MGCDTKKMFTYNCLNPISDEGIGRLTKEYMEVKNAQDAQAIFVRSASMHGMEFGEGTLGIARAGAGVNNIPLEACAEKGIVVFNTPGANANGVKELVVAGMLLASRDIVGGINWVQENEEDGDLVKRTEKEKKRFSGTELEGKKLGVIGLGAIGVLVANVAIHLGMDVYGYDPYISVDAAWKLSRSIHHAKTMDELFRECDFLTVHVPATEQTIGLINKNSISLMKKNVVILNFARDTLVNSEDIVDALLTGKVHRYVTDFPTPEIAGVKGAIVIPHLGASTEESEDNCARMAVMQMLDFLENGNITHSVNFPDCHMGDLTSGDRITIMHRNIPNMIGQFTSLLAKEQLNIDNMANKSRKEYAYTVIDLEGEAKEALVSALSAIDGVLRVRVIGSSK